MLQSGMKKINMPLLMMNSLRKEIKGSAIENFYFLKMKLVNGLIFDEIIYSVSTSIDNLIRVFIRDLIKENLDNL